MSFEDLPADWPTRPVTDPEITADLLDLVVTDRDRAAGAVVVLVCGRESRLAQPVVIGEPPQEATAAERRRPFDVLCQAVNEVGAASGAGLLVAVARPGPPLLTPADRRWRDAAATSCADAGVDLLGTWLVTPGHIRPMGARRGDRRSA